MVCRRCSMVVQSVLENLHLHPVSVTLGEAEIQENSIDGIRDELQIQLQKVGFELMNNKKSRTIEKIKTLIIDLVHNKSNQLNVNLSSYLSQQLQQDYSSLSNLFSEVEGTTIEKYFIHQKIEKVKELLVYEELSLSEIAFQLNYSSTAHLSSQFKKITGFTASHYRQMKNKKRQHIEDTGKGE